MNKWLKNILITTVAISSQFHTNLALAEEIVKPSDWYLHVDVKALKTSALADKFIKDAKEKSEGLAIFNQVFSEEIINNMNYIALQGDVDEKENKVMLIQGDFTNKHKLVTDKFQELGLSNTIDYKGKTIYHGNLEKLAARVQELQKQMDKKPTEEKKITIRLDKDNQQNTVLYSAFKSEDIIIISDNLAKVQLWLSQAKKWDPKMQSSVFEVVVDIKKSFLHGGINIDEMNENFNFESISAKQISQVSASYNESNGYIELQLGIETSDTETATRIKSVANGLIALKILSENNRAVVNLLSNIQFEQDAGNLLIKLTGPVESFNTLINQENLM